MEVVKRLFSTVKHYRWRSLFAVVALVVVGVGLAQPSYAQWWFSPVDDVLLLVSSALYFLLIFVMGILATKATDVLVYTAQLSNFTDLPVIIEAWSVVRDLSNMFFIVILLVIAFGTLFRLEAYSWKKLLPKMVLAAVLMNYSRAICGFIVDASQVIMLTFVAAIKDAASVGLAESFNLSQLLQFDTSLTVDEDGTGVNSPQSRLVAIVAAGFMLATMFTVQCVYIVVLVGRLVMIWFLTVLSPLAYVSKVLPATERYASQWWEMFGRYVVVGPMCMFFLWLAMFIAAKSISSGGLGSIAAGEELTFAQEQDQAAGFVIDAAVFDPTLIAGFVIATMMLMAGMKLAQENSSEIGGATSKVADLGKSVAKFAAYGGAAAGGVFVGGLAIDGLQHRTGLDLNLKRQWASYQHERGLQKDRRFAKGYAKASKRAVRGDWTSMLGAAGYWGEHYAPVVGEMGFAKFLTQKGKSKEIAKKQAERTDLQKQQDDLTTETAGATGLAEQHLIDEETKRSELTRLAREEASIDRPGGTTGNDFDLNQSGDRAVLEAHRDQMAQELTAAEASNDHVAAELLMGEIATANAALAKGGKVTVIIGAGERAAAVTKAKANNAAEMRAMRARSSLGGAIANKQDLKNVISGSLDKVTNPTFADAPAGVEEAIKNIQSKAQAKAKIQERIDGINGYIQENRAPIDPEVVNKQREVAQKTFKELVTDNEEYLMDEIKNRLHHGDYSAALAVGEHMSKVGHDNEIPRAAGYGAGPEGMRAWYEDLVAKGADEQLVLSSIQQMCSNAQSNNHWQMAQLVGVKDGKRYMRSAGEAALARRIEAEKYGVDRFLQNANRLGPGEYTDPENEHWQLLPEMAAMLAENMHKVSKTINDGRVNTNMAAHLAIPSEAAKMRQLITSVQSPATLQQALDNFEKIIRGAQPLDTAYADAVGMSIRRAESVAPRATLEDIRKASKSDH
ncbi:MAG: hypothetical protein HY565_02410 [Candidatus Kerfeldbacteria bacterium]|nr:hypothetical protein [Candidatus Kerfeldbacteria bacterium]